MKKTVITLLIGVLLGAGGMYALSLRAHLAILDLKGAESLNHAIFSLELYRQYGIERHEWFLEHDVKCKVFMQRQIREENIETYPGWFYSPKPVLTGKALEKAVDLVGTDFICESGV